METTYSVIVIQRNGMHDIYQNIGDRQAVERKFDALKRVGVTDCRIMVLKTETNDVGDQSTTLCTHFNSSVILKNRL